MNEWDGRNKMSYYNILYEYIPSISNFYDDKKSAAYAAVM